MKRFTETLKWDKEWFQELACRHKCLWLYICDKADPAGVWEPNWKLASLQIGERVSEKDLEKFGRRVDILKSGKIIVIPFIEFQYGRLSRECKAHIPIFRAIEKHTLSLPYPIPYPKAMHSLQEKETEEDMKKEKETDGVRVQREGIPENEKNTPESPMAIRIANLFHRRLSTGWSKAEIAAFKSLGEILPEDMDAIDAYYANERAMPDGWHRKDLSTFLNNFRGELDRANAWIAKGRPSIPHRNGGPKTAEEKMAEKRAGEYPLQGKVPVYNPFDHPEDML